jgi:hypothetical protein
VWGIKGGTPFEGEKYLPAHKAHHSSATDVGSKDDLALTVGYLSGDDLETGFGTVVPETVM